MKWLDHPLTRGIRIDDPDAVELRRSVIALKSFLRRIYEEWYSSLARALPSGDGPVVELGSGPGFLGEFVPGVIRSDVVLHRYIDSVADAACLPFASKTLRGIMMVNVLHHLAKPRGLFSEATRCLMDHGVVVLIEPWATPWSRFVYTRLHHEPFDPIQKVWESPETGPMSGANGALPWIIFGRDRAKFALEFPQLEIEAITLDMPFRYLLSGGLSKRAITPNWTFPLWAIVERLLRPVMTGFAMFATIVLRKNSGGIVQ